MHASAPTRLRHRRARLLAASLFLFPGLGLGPAMSAPNPAAPVSGQESPPAPAPAQGQVWVDVTSRDTAALYAACAAEGGHPSGWCSAYLMGVADVLTVIGNGGSPAGICKANYGIEELPVIFRSWVDANAGQPMADMLLSAMLAFRQRWPC